MKALGLLAGAGSGCRFSLLSHVQFRGFLRSYPLKHFPCPPCPRTLRTCDIYQHSGLAQLILQPHGVSLGEAQAHKRLDTATKSGSFSGRRQCAEKHLRTNEETESPDHDSAELREPLYQLRS